MQLFQVCFLTPDILPFSSLEANWCAIVHLRISGWTIAHFGVNITQFRFVNVPLCHWCVLFWFVEHLKEIIISLNISRKIFRRNGLFFIYRVLIERIEIQQELRKLLNIIMIPLVQSGPSLMCFWNLSSLPKGQMQASGVTLSCVNRCVPFWLLSQSPDFYKRWCELDAFERYFNTVLPSD